VTAPEDALHAACLNECMVPSRQLLAFIQLDVQLCLQKLLQIIRQLIRSGKQRGKLCESHSSSVDDMLAVYLLGAKVVLENMNFISFDCPLFRPAGIGIDCTIRAERRENVYVGFCSSPYP
jgi:hypothetical protein